MGEYDSPARHLPFPLDDSSLIQRTTEDDVECETSSFVWPEDPEERTLVPFYLSQREYMVLASAVDAGSDIAYSDDAIRVWWLWARNMRCKVAICSMIIDCIYNDQDTRTTIINMLLNDPDFVDGIKEIATGINPVNPIKIVNPIVESCDKDVLFGAITNIISTMNRVNEDAFEIMEEATNDEERFALIVEAIPGLSEFIPAELIDLAQQLVENMQENYSAEWTTVLEDEIRMDLLCLAEKNCEITLAMIYDYFSNRIGGSLSIGTAFTSAIAFLAAGDFPGQQIVNFAFMLQLVALRGGSEFFGVSLYTVDLQAQLGANNPNNDWSLLDPGNCPEDDTGCIEYEFDVSKIDVVQGHNTRIPVKAGQLVTITATGSYTYNNVGGTAPTPEGPTPEGGLAGPGWLAPDAKLRELIAKVGVTGTYHSIGEEGEFTAETDGTIYLDINEAIAGRTNDNVGIITAEICVPPVPIVLQKTADNYKLKLIDDNDNEPIYEAEPVYTGHYVVFSSVEVNNTTFYVKAIHIINPDQYTDDDGKLGLGAGTVQAWWNLYEVPQDVGSTVLALQNLTAGTKIRFTLTTVIGEVGELVPVTTGALP